MANSSSIFCLFAGLYNDFCEGRNIIHPNRAAGKWFRSLSHLRSRHSSPIWDPWDSISGHPVLGHRTRQQQERWRLVSVHDPLCLAIVFMGLLKKRHIGLFKHQVCHTFRFMQNPSNFSLGGRIESDLSCWLPALRPASRRYRPINNMARFYSFNAAQVRLPISSMHWKMP